MTIVGCYTMDLYCLRETCEREKLANTFRPAVQPCPHQFTGQTEAQCRREARRVGWRFSKGDVTCPHCATASVPSTPKPLHA
jgi:hypothetical protein